MLQHITVLGRYTGTDKRGIIIGGLPFYPGMNPQKIRVDEDTFKTLLRGVENGWFEIKEDNYHQFKVSRYRKADPVAPLEQVKVLAQEPEVEEQKVEEQKVEETEETKVEETKVEEQKVEETEETKVRETKVEETKVEETKVEETKVEETKVEETPATTPKKKGTVRKKTAKTNEAE